jgi:PAS domain S-box-containing protein
LLIPFVFFFIILIAGIKIERNLWGLLVITYFSIFAIYSYLFNKSADEVVEAGYKIAASETEIGRLNAQLEKKLEETNAELYRKNKELESALAEAGRAADSLQKQQEDLQIILDSAPTWIFYKDKENRFVRVNKVFADIMGSSKEQLEGKSLFNLYPREQAEAFWRDDKEVMASGRPKMNIIESVEIKKELRWVQTDKIPYRDAQGNIIGIIGFAVDITERQQAEEELKKRAEELEKMNKFMVGRELDMIELKKEVNRLLSELGRPEKYRA